MVDGFFVGCGVINFGVFLMNTIQPTSMIQIISGMVGLIISGICFGIAFNKK